MSVAKYITRSPKRGTYSYRRRVPDQLKEKWGQREVKQSLGTTNYTKALSLASKVNANFEAKADKLKRRHDDVSPQQVYFTLQEASDYLRKTGVHPDQKPSFDAPNEEVQAYEESLEAFFSNYQDLKVDDVDPITWETRYKPDSPTNPYDQAYQLVQGRGHMSIEPTLKDALDTYLRLNQEKRQRSEHNKKKFDQANTRAADRFAMFLGNGSLKAGYTPKLSSLSRVVVRRFRDDLRQQNPNWTIATLNKDVQRLRAMYLMACKEYELNLPNHFSGMQLEVSKQDTKPKRRPFSIEELQLYLDALRDKSVEVRLVGLLMAQTGARTMEIAGLTRGEIDLSVNVPHIKIRYNHIRVLKNDSSVREVPVFGEALDLLRDYTKTLDNTEPDAPLFPRFGRAGGMDNISQQLNRIIRKQLGISDKTLVAYSTRHRMKDRLRAIRTPQEVQHAILGHTSDNKTAEGYGTGQPLDILQSELIRAGEELQ
jgi:integrase